MSKFVKWLLFNREELLADESGEYTDYIIELDSVIKKLVKENGLTAKQLSVISLREKQSRNWLAIFNSAVRKISSHLGPEFSDDSWVSRLIQEKSLDKEHAEKLYSYVKGNGRIEI